VILDELKKPRGVNRPVRVEDVAREAGVSPITVSRALSTPEKVKPETRQRVEEAVVKTGYVVNSIASSLRSGRSSIVTVFVTSLQNPHFANAMQGAIDAFEGSRYHLMFAQTGYSDDPSPHVLESVLPFRPAGVMFTDVVRRKDTREALRTLGVPVVEMWGDDTDPIDMVVGSSGYDGGQMMGRHFGERGFRHIAYCGHTIERASGRFEGFEAGLAEHGAKVSLVMPRDGTSAFSDGILALDEILERLPTCDAIFFGTDVLAVGAIIGARRRNIAVPRQLAFAGYGDLDFSAHVEPPITSIHVSHYDIGRRAGEMLLRRLNGKSVDQPIIQVPVSLEIRGSTGAEKTGR
jgi:LacI family transcriptional regulator, gluconate utilization system Gnt-I transcriptional repressor